MQKNSTSLLNKANKQNQELLHLQRRDQQTLIFIEVPEPVYA